MYHILCNMNYIFYIIYCISCIIYYTLYIIYNTYHIHIIYFIISSKCRLLHFYERHLVAISVVKWYYTYICAFLWSEMTRTGVPHIVLHILCSTCTHWGILGPLKLVLALQRRGHLCCYGSTNFENTDLRAFFFKYFV